MSLVPYKRAYDTAMGAYDAYSSYRKAIGPVNIRSRYKVGLYNKKAKYGPKGRANKKWRSKAEIKKVINSMKETKRVDYSHGRQTLYHNGGISVTPVVWPIKINADPYRWAPTQGDGDGQRDGNDIFIKGITLRMMYNLPADRLNVKIRNLLIKVPRGYGVASYTDVMDNITGNSQIDPIDKDRCKVVSQWFTTPTKVNPSSGATGKESTSYKKIYVPINKVCKFVDDGSLANFDEWDYYLLQWAYDTYTSLPGDAIAYCQLWGRTTFKD